MFEGRWKLKEREQMKQNEPQPTPESQVSWILVLCPGRICFRALLSLYSFTDKIIPQGVMIKQGSRERALNNIFKFCFESSIFCIVREVEKDF